MARMGNRRFVLISFLAGLFTLTVLIVGANGSSQRVVFAQQATPLATSAAPQGDVARGKYLVSIAGCVGCHGTASLATGDSIPLAGGTAFNLGPLGTFYSRNLTILQDWTVADFDKAIRQGRDPYPDSPSSAVLAPVMPYMDFHSMSDDDLASIAAYLKSLTPVQNTVPNDKPGALAAFALHPLNAETIAPVKVSDSADYGAYLVRHISICGSCHTPRDAFQAPIASRELAGGTLNLGTDQTPVYAPPILGTVLTAQGFTRDNFITAMRTGILPWGGHLPPAMPWRAYANMTDSDLTAVWNFIQTKKLDQPWPSAGGNSATQAAAATP